LLIYGDMTVNNKECKEAIKNLTFEIEVFNSLEKQESIEKEFIILYSENSYFVSDAIEYGNSLGYQESNWCDLYSFSKVSKNKTSVLNVLETSEGKYFDGQGLMVVYMNKQKKFKLTFKNTRHLDFGVLMVKEKNSL